MIRMIKKLLKSVREYKIYAILTPIFVMVEVIMEVVLPYLMSLLIDKGVYAENMTAAFRYGGLLLLAAFIALLFGFLSAKNDAKAGAGFAKNLRKDL
jgi:ATP-binding cassette subfamily B protein